MMAGIEDTRVITQGQDWAKLHIKHKIQQLSFGCSFHLGVVAVLKFSHQQYYHALSPVL